ncbi:methyltransferase domain-containing protein [Iamia majanohamensis]|uniref:Methyltransferase domain-containing protein n=1 Tax=Iamia majanohamensis TaxID=467976 RepID=A0AAF0BWY5_9ACTN|nr:class I SAM-dependent methyltransferase [Iamia majanohamensis]WCO68004.1 methyltransferase domain-containing protein [Iamia majanohamensis]
MPNQEQIAYWSGNEGEQWSVEGERYDRMLRAFGEDVLDALDPGAAERILDVGCGNGALTLAAAEQVRPQGTVMGIDIATPMLTRARGRANQGGVDNVSFTEADAQVHPFPPASFDGVMSRFGVMFFDDPVAAFTNLRGALRPGGRMVFACWQDLLVNDWLMIPAAAALEHIPMPDLTEAAGSGPFSMTDPDHVRDLLTRSGFVNIDIKAVVEPMWLGADTADTIAFLRRTDMAQSLMAEAEAEAVDHAWQAVSDVVAAHAGDGSVTFNGAAWIVTAHRS